MTSQPLREKLCTIPHHDMDFYKSADGYECDLRILLNDKYREDTRSRIRLNPDNTIKSLIIRFPSVEDASDKQDTILQIARRRFDRRAGCYGRSGNLHMKFPVTGELFDYTIEEFIDDYEGFKSEVEKRITFAE